MKRFFIILMCALMLTSGTISAFAMEYPSNLPELPENNGSDSYVVYEYHKGVGLLIIDGSDKSGYHVEYKGDNRLYVTVDHDWYLHWYHLEDNEWVFETTYNETANRIVDFGMGTFYSFLYSDIDIYDEEGELFFPLPLAEEIRGVAEETLTAEIPELNKMVLVVVLCGVGCLALVTSLVLFRKVLPNFLK